MNNPTEEELRFLRKQSTKNHNLQCACNHLNYEKRQLTKRIAELEAQIQTIAEALEDFAKPPYKDSDLASLLEYHNKRAMIEVKSGKARQQANQKRFLALVAAAGGISGEARSPEDAEQILLQAGVDPVLLRRKK